MASDGRFTDAEHRQILDAIGAAERMTSGEIRLFVEDVCGENVLDRAAYIFHELKMDRTAERNGVLFYLALEARQFAILGDAGINRKVPEDFWHSIKLEMEHRFALGEFVTGLSTGIERAGAALAEHFPRKHDDKNELSDEIVYGGKLKDRHPR